MLEKITKPKVLIVAAAIAGIFALVCIVLLAMFGWTAFSQRGTPSPTSEPDAFGYCGAELSELCVVSFGRDAFGDTIVNLYVPQKTYPPFYLNIVRRSGEGRYECVGNKSIKTSFYCTGDPINLGEGFEIQMLSEKDDRLLARGTFTLTAFLVTTQIADGTSTPTDTATKTPSTTSYPSYP